jgi:hypothetical protein
MRHRSTLRVTCIIGVTLSLFTAAPGALSADLPRAVAYAGSPGWTKLFLDKPFGVFGTLTYDPARNRVLLNGQWEIDLQQPDVFKKIEGAGSVSGIYDPIGDRLVNITSGAYPDSMYAYALPLATPGPAYGIPSVSSPVGTNWTGYTQTFNAAANEVTLFGGSSRPLSGGPNESIGWTCRVNLSSGIATFSAPGYPFLGPEKRYGHSTTLDPSRNHMVVFGGTNEFQSFNDVVIGALDGTSWSRPTIAGTPPAARTRHATAYDPGGDRVIVYGGYSLNDVWALRLSDPMLWTRLLPTGAPPAIGTSGGSAVYDPRVGRVLIYGPGDHYDELWSLSLGPVPAWTNNTIPHPKPTVGRLVVGDPVRRSVLVHGAEGDWNEVWDLSFDSSTWTQRTPAGTPPPRRQYQAGVYDIQRERLVIFGGVESPRYNDVWALSSGPTPTWTHLLPQGTPPSPRFGAAAVYDPGRQLMFVFGGQYDGLTFFNDVWALNLAGTPSWTPFTPAGTPPSPRAGSSAVYDPVRDQILIIGSKNDGQVWSLSLAGPLTWQLLPSCPETDVSSGPPAIYDPVGDRVLMTTHGKVYALTFDPVPEWQQIEPTSGGPPGSNEGDIVYDEVTDRYFMMPSSSLLDTYVLTVGATVDVPTVKHAASIELACWPNPSEQGAATMRFTVAAPAHVRLTIHDIEGRLVRTLVDGASPAGRREVRWDGLSQDGSAVPAGIYLCSLNVGGVRAVRRLAVTR